MRRGFQGLSAQVQTVLEQEPYSGHVFVFRGRRGDLIKLLWFDDDGLCLFQKRLERGRFIWPQAMRSAGTRAACPAARSFHHRPRQRGLFRAPNVNQNAGSGCSGNRCKEDRGKPQRIVLKRI
jgi:hypothetical protein